MSSLSAPPPPALPRSGDRKLSFTWRLLSKILDNYGSNPAHLLSFSVSIIVTKDSYCVFWVFCSYIPCLRHLICQKYSCFLSLSKKAHEYWIMLHKKDILLISFPLQLLLFVLLIKIYFLTKQNKYSNIISFYWWRRWETTNLRFEKYNLWPGCPVAFVTKSLSLLCVHSQCWAVSTPSNSQIGQHRGILGKCYFLGFWAGGERGHAMDERKG